jgi:hypothetical protein
VFFLWAMSPMALDRFKLPSILPSTFTVEPALYILSLSFLFYGLWSKLIGKALPPSPRTHLESPALAHIRTFFYIARTLAVHPLLSIFSAEYLFCLIYYMACLSA